MRLISVVMGSDTSENRSKSTVELMDYGFNNYKLNTIYNKNIKLGKVKVLNGKKDYVNLKLVSDVVDLTTILEESKYDYKMNIDEIKAPVSVGDVVGKLTLFKDGKKIDTFDITVKESIKKANILDYYKKNFKYIISGNV